MTHGRPDWNTAINIAGQDIPQVIERPKYGAALTATASETIAEEEMGILTAIAGVGMIYGGAIRQEGSFDPAYITIGVQIDEITAIEITLEQLNTWMIEDDTMYHVYEKYYSEANDKYVQGITRSITFEESYILYVRNYTGSGASVTVGSLMIYAVI